MSDFPTPRASSTQAIDAYMRQVRHVTAVTKATEVLDTFADECKRLGFSQVARAEGAASFAERFGFIDHDTYIAYVQAFHEAAK